MCITVVEACLRDHDLEWLAKISEFSAALASPLGTSICVLLPWLSSIGSRVDPDPCYEWPDDRTSNTSPSPEGDPVPSHEWPGDRTSETSPSPHLFPRCGWWKGRVHEMPAHACYFHALGKYMKWQVQLIRSDGIAWHMQSWWASDSWFVELNTEQSCLCITELNESPVLHTARGYVSHHISNANLWMLPPMRQFSTVSWLQSQHLWIVISIHTCIHQSRGYETVFHESSTSCEHHSNSHIL